MRALAYITARFWEVRARRARAAACRFERRAEEIFRNWGLK